ncbi:YfcE family phosphodiesterase [Alkalicoccus luteus]|uniref:Phosphoesterase n=1 Tax=Alkalicoccus luteus TaxID=1237094 RepID=A0A969PM47_9BACI|nr:metallophosphoesterase [Alkalicoccus luteus]
MKVLIMSDSHGWTNEVAEVVERHREEVEGVIHCGDSELEAEAEELKGTAVVRGNCDMHSGFPEELTEEFAGLRFFAAHGHLLNVKTTEMNLLYKAEEQEADIVCFGHTHVPAAVQEKDTILINPGSMRLPRQYSDGTYVLLENGGSQVTVTFMTMDGEPVEELSKTFTIRG